jgi:hypothetical protein
VITVRLAADRLRRRRGKLGAGHSGEASESEDLGDSHIDRVNFLFAVPNRK